ncbi:hypothetical protein [Alteromonas lipolytica]|uniref:Uncharacterized protein n=1 Tax=Alteromonas lipolytica TaxID=1856405 RepID=A0A1E8FFH4_9ALTE|nr:hypothetical protein [Alteromonas lipolytica]OFI34707.1 hypothetical protein BFC17_14090 [Alteromonas lipolytica]GGF53343.1 hypothetical protein GCM10011338_01850 [Alteromonas lipolytica]
MEIRQGLITPNVEGKAQQPRPVAKPGTVKPADGAQPLSVAELQPRAGNAESKARADAFRQSTGYDKPQGPAILAIEAYGSHERETKKAAIREMMGVDIYA